MYIQEKDLCAIEKLWGELGEFPPSALGQAQEHCFRELGRLIGAANIFWVAGSLEPPARADDRMRGWRVRAFCHLYHDGLRDQLQAAAARHVGSGLPDPHAEAMAATAGATRAFLRPEIVDDRTWHRSWLDRARGRRFGARERDILRLFLAGAPRFHRDVLRAHGLLDCAKPLSPREQQVLQLLLTGLTEKQIAAELGLGWRTTHEHAVSIFRKFGVQRRTGLMALWLDGRRSIPAK